MEELLERNKKLKYKFSKTSLAKFKNVHPKLIDFAFTLADIIDIRIVYGERTGYEQNKLFREGKSSKDGIVNKSNHQAKKDGLVYALDILPLPKGVNMYLDDGKEDNIRWGQFDGLCQGVAHTLGIQIRTGFKWRDTMMKSLERAERENTLPDGNHVEFIKVL